MVFASPPMNEPYEPSDGGGVVAVVDSMAVAILWMLMCCGDSGHMCVWGGGGAKFRKFIVSASVVVMVTGDVPNGDNGGRPPVIPSGHRML